MNPTRLRRLIKKYGDGGILFAGCCLGWRHLWTKRRSLLIGGLSILCSIALLLFWGRPDARLRTTPPLLLTSHLQPVTQPDTIETLLKRATRVTSPRSEYWWGGDWLNSREKLDWRHDGNNSERFSCDVTRHNVYTGVEKLLGTIPSRADRGPVLPEVSPDGSLLLWGDVRDRYFVSTVDRKHTYYLPTNLINLDGGWWSFTGLIWRGNSENWLLFIWDDRDTKGKQVLAGPRRLAVGSIHDPLHYRIITVSKHSPLYRLTDAAFGAVMITPDLMLASDSSDEKQEQNKITFWILDLNKHAMPIHRYLITFPNHWNVYASDDQLLFTRTHDRIAWMLYKMRAGKIVDESLWVSRRDGSRMHEIGEIRTHGNKNNELEDLRWLPDGKRLSFIYHDALYIVPAE